MPMPNAVPTLVVAVSVDGGALGVTVVDAGPGALRVRIRVETSIVPSVIDVSCAKAAVLRMASPAANAPVRHFRVSNSIDVLLRSRALQACARLGWIKPAAKGR